MPREQVEQYDPTKDPINKDRLDPDRNPNPLSDREDYLRRYQSWLSASGASKPYTRDMGLARLFGDPRMFEWVRSQYGSTGPTGSSTNPTDGTGPRYDLYPYDSDQDRKIRDMVLNTMTGYGMDRFISGDYSPDKILDRTRGITETPNISQLQELQFYNPYLVDPGDNMQTLEQMSAPSVSGAMRYGQGAADLAARSAALQASGAIRGVTSNRRLNSAALASLGSQVAQQAASGVGAAGAAGFGQGISALQQTGQSNLQAALQQQAANQATRQQSLLANQQANMTAAQDSASTWNQATYFNKSAQAERRAQELGLLQKSLDQSYAAGNLGLDKTLGAIFGRPDAWWRGGDTYRGNQQGGLELGSGMWKWPAGWSHPDMDYPDGWGGGAGGTGTGGAGGFGGNNGGNWWENPNPWGDGRGGYSPVGGGRGRDIRQNPRVRYF